MWLRVHLSVIVALVCIVAAGVTTPTPAEAELRPLAAKPSDIRPVKIGQLIEDQEVYDVDGNKHRLRAILAKKPTLLVVFRGGWCIYCSRQLSQLGKSLNAFRELGWQIVGLSPDPPEDLKKATAKLKLEYELFSDPQAMAIRKMGLAYTPTAADFSGEERFVQMWREKYGPIQKTDTPALPVPGVFLVHRNGLVVYNYVNVDFRVRLSGLVLLSAAKAYREKEKK